MASKRGLLNLQNLSKEELLKIIYEKLPELVSNNVSKSKKANVSERNFDPTAYECRMVALKVAYFGMKYQGFASQVGLVNLFNNPSIVNSNADTVEDHLFRAMIRTRLILDAKACNYSRCGRTDSGVSSTGQVIALKLRTSNQKQGNNFEENVQIDYLRVLNKQLPEDIRILDWSFVPDDFSARFSCSSRLYHYYFSHHHFSSSSGKLVNLDIETMQKAANVLIGVHDYRNFCRKDPSKPEQSFVREVIECRIEEVVGMLGFYRFICRGSAFLYHQIRCFMAILFRIGSGDEPVELIDLMLRKIYPKNECLSYGPLITYDFAPAIPLTLHECSYEKPGSPQLSWNIVRKNDDNQLISHIARLWESRQAEALIIKGLVPNDIFVNENCSGKNGDLFKKLDEI